MKERMAGLVYDWASFSLANGQTDYNVKTEQAALFNNVPHATGMAIFFDQEIGLRWNSTVMPKVTLSIDRSPFQSPANFIEIKNIFLSNASDDATVQIYLW